MTDKVCYYNNGTSMRWVAPDYAVVTGEVLFDETPTSEQLAAAFPSYDTAENNEILKSQIATLEAQVTNRRIREAAIGSDSGWLENLNSQIVALRAELVEI